MMILAGTLPPELFSIRFLVILERGPLAVEAEALGVRVDLLGMRRDCSLIRPRCLAAAAQAIRRYRALTADVDIVDAWQLPALTLAAFARPIARVPIVMGGRRSLADQYRSKRWYRRSAAGLAARRMDAIVANSRVAAAEAVEHDRVDPARVHVIPNAVLVPSSRPGDRTRYRAAWQFTEDHFVVGCVANYKPAKGLGYLLDAVGRLRKRLPALRVVIVGEGPLRKQLEADIRNLQLESVVVLHGSEDDARAIYPSFDILVQASETEGLPNVILEAAVTGLPIVATAAGGTTEILTNEQHALIVATRDPARLAEAILRLAEDRQLRERLGQAARERASDFSPERLAATTAALYVDLAARKLDWPRESASV
jgi:glycosyltransferase involved in cell wall biosynthesis